MTSTSLTSEFIARANERDAMVRDQLRARGLDDERVLSAMRHVSREAFVPAASSDDAYSDRALPLAFGQTISQPYMVALSSALAQVEPTDRVLEIGTGSGYQAAVLATLCRELVSIERVHALAVHARETLAHLGIENVTVLEGDGSLGAPERAPFDAIVVTAAAPSVPTTLIEQLRVGGRLVLPVGPRHEQRLIRILKRADGAVDTTDHGACVYVPLIGEKAWT